MSMIANSKYNPYLSFLRMQESGFYSTLPGNGEIPAFAGMTIIPLNDNKFYRIIIN
jgi:hypothetical protein